MNLGGKTGAMNQMALDSASMGITQEAVLRNVNRDLQTAAAQEAAGEEVTAFSLEHTAEALEEAAAQPKGDTLADEIDEFDEFDDDPALRALEARRIAQLKSRCAAARALRAHAVRRRSRRPLTRRRRAPRVPRISA